MGSLDQGILDFRSPGITGSENCGITELRDPRFFMDPGMVESQDCRIPVYVLVKPGTNWGMLPAGAGAPLSIPAPG